MTTKAKQKSNPDTARYLIVAALVVAAFFGAYRFAQASNSQGSAGVANAASQIGLAAPVGGAAAGGGAGAGAPAGGGGCCGGGGAAAAPVTGAAKLEGGVQKISVDVARTYNPNVIQLKAGVPAEITFSQSQGCTAIVQSSDLGFQEDLSSGPKTVKLKGLAAGTYSFACGMNMVTGTIVVQ
jgi:plastocyanin